MATKSLVRKAAEEAMGLDPTVRINCWVDRSKSGHRAKFQMIKPGPIVMASYRKRFAELLPHNDTRVWWVARQNYGYGYSGIAFKVFNKENY